MSSVPKRSSSSSTLAAYSASPGGPRLLAVGGGKDECGKSMVSAYLAISMARQGKKVVVVDCQSRTTRLQHLLGADGKRAQPTEYAERSEIPLDAWLGTSVEGVALLANVDGDHETDAEPHFIVGPKLTDALRPLPVDVVILDIGKDQNLLALDLYNQVDQRLIVATPHFLSIQYAFAFQKTAVQRLVRSCAGTQEQLRLFENECDPSEADTLPDTLLRLGARDPSYLAAIKKRFQHYRSNLVGNLVMDDREENVLHAVARMMRHYLNISVPVAGCLRASLQLYDLARGDNAPALGHTPLENEERVEDIVAHLLREKIVQAPLPTFHDANDFDFGEGAVLSSTVEAAATEKRVDSDFAGVSMEASAENATSGEGVSISPYQRKSERIRLHMKVRVRRGSDMFDADLLELSENGASIRTDAVLRAGMWLDAFFQAEEQKAYSYEIRSVRDANVYGLELLESFIPYAQIAQWAAAYPVKGDDGDGGSFADEDANEPGILAATSESTPMVADP